VPTKWIQQRATEQIRRGDELQRLHEAAPAFLTSVADALRNDIEYYSEHIGGETPQLGIDIKRLSGQLSLSSMAAFFEYDVAGGKLAYYFQPTTAPAGSIEGIALAPDGISMTPPNDSYDAICEAILGPVLFPHEQ
jgi:hypothetical protein